jgi:hypothetical protein
LPPCTILFNIHLLLQSIANLNWRCYWRSQLQSSFDENKKRHLFCIALQTYSKKKICFKNFGFHSLSPPPINHHHKNFHNFSLQALWISESLLDILWWGWNKSNSF